MRRAVRLARRAPQEPGRVGVRVDHRALQPGAVVLARGVAVADDAVDGVGDGAGDVVAEDPVALDLQLLDAELLDAVAGVEAGALDDPVLDGDALEDAGPVGAALDDAAPNDEAPDEAVAVPVRTAHAVGDALDAALVGVDADGTDGTDGPVVGGVADGAVAVGAVAVGAVAVGAVAVGTATGAVVVVVADGVVAVAVADGAAVPVADPVGTAVAVGLPPAVTVEAGQVVDEEVPALDPLLDPVAEGPAVAAVVAVLALAAVVGTAATGVEETSPLSGGAEGAALVTVPDAPLTTSVPSR